VPSSTASGVRMSATWSEIVLPRRRGAGLADHRVDHGYGDPRYLLLGVPVGKTTKVGMELSKLMQESSHARSVAPAVTSCRPGSAMPQVPTDDTPRGDATATAWLASQRGQEVHPGAAGPFSSRGRTTGSWISSPGCPRVVCRTSAPGTVLQTRAAHTSLKG